MICYKDMTFCPFHNACVNGKECERALTDEVKKNANKWWGEGEAPICMFVENPDCFKEKNDTAR